MPAGGGTAYRSLPDDVYKSTTVSENKFSVIESVKKAFSFAGAAGAGGAKGTDPLIMRGSDGDNRPVRVIRVNKEMPTSASPEETALLG